MSDLQAQRAMYAPRPPESFANTAPLAKSDNTDVSHDHTGQAQPRARSALGSPRSDRRAWAIWLAVLVPVILLIVTHAMRPTVTTKDVGSYTPPLIRENVTLDVDDQIISLIDGYTPFLSPGTPLLKLGSVRLTVPDSQSGMNRAWLEGPKGKPEAWNLALTGRVCSDICLSPIVTHSEPYSNLERVCWALKEGLKWTRERQMAVAHRLAGPGNTVLWLDLVERMLFGLIDNLSHVKRRSEAERRWYRPVSNFRKQKTAEILRRYVNKKGPWYFIHEEMRRELLQLREDCRSIADDLGKLYLDYFQALATLGLHSGEQQSDVGLGETTHVPQAHIRLLISGIDDLLGALDEVEKGLHQLDTLLRARVRAGWEVEELKNGVRVRTRIELPDPLDIRSAIVERLSMEHRREKLRKTSKMRKAWSDIRAADESLVDCLKQEARAGWTYRLVGWLDMSRLNHCISEPTTHTAAKETLGFRPPEQLNGWTFYRKLRRRFPDLVN